jgi:rSAM/selenodomain-associated transferase 1
LATIELCCAPDTRHGFFADCVEDFGASLTPQGEGHLGDRMLDALTRALKTHRAAIIVGADCPALTGRHIAEAAAMLAAHDAVLTPAEDGGYVLIGVTRADPRLFEDIEWGGDQVLARQRQNFSELGFRCHEMPTLWDVDRPEDLPRLKTLKPPLDFFWPA